MFFDLFMKNAAGISDGLRIGAAAGQAVTGFFDHRAAHEAFKADAAVARLSASQDAALAQRQTRYKMGLSRAANAGAGNTAIGTQAYIMADNAFHKELTDRARITEAELSIAAQRGGLTTRTAAVTNAASLLFGAGAGVMQSRLARTPLSPITERY